MVREEFERKGRANVVHVATPRVLSHFCHRVLPDANLTVFDRTESFDPIVEQIIQSSAEALRLLFAEVADVEGRILESSFELRSARLLKAGSEVSKHGLRPGFLLDLPIQATSACGRALPTLKVTVRLSFR